MKRFLLVLLASIFPALALAQTQPVYVVNGSSTDAVNVQDGGNSLTVDGTVTCNAGSGTLAVSGNWLTDTQLRASAVPVTCNAGSGTFAVSGTFWPTTAAAPSSTRLSDGAAFYDAAKTGQFPAALVSGRLDVNLGAWLGSTAPTVGQKTMANSIPVTLASDQSTLTISGTVTANAGTGVFDVTPSSPAANDYLPVRLTDGSSFYSASGGGGGTSSSFGSAFPATGTASGFSDGTNMQGARVFDLDSGGGTQYGFGVNLRKIASGGSVEAGTSSDPLRVDPTGTTTQPVSGTITANIGTSGSLALEAGNLATVAGAVHNEDAASLNDHPGIAAMAVRKATPANTSGTDGDYEMLQMSAGRLWTSTTLDAAIPTGSNVIGALTANQSVNVAQVAGTTTDTNSGNKSAGTIRMVIATDQPQLTNALKVDGSAVTQPVSGTVTANAGTGTFTVGGVAAHDAAVSGNPVLTGGYASAAAPSDVSGDGDMVRAWHLRNGSYVANLAAGGTLITSTGSSINVNCTGGCTPGGSFNDSSAFTFGTTAIGNIGAVVDDTSTNTVAENSAGAPRMNTNRILYSNLRNNAGTEVGTSGAPLRVDPTGTTTQPISGTVTTTPPSNASTNVAQFGGTNVSTGTGAGGAGIPRVTLSNDSSLAANQSVNTAQYGGTNVSATNAHHVRGGQATQSTATVTSASGTGSIIQVTATGYSTILVNAVATGTVTGGLVTGYDNTDSQLHALHGIRTSDAGIITSVTLATGLNETWAYNVEGVTTFQLRLNSALTGTGSVAFSVNPGYGPHYAVTVDPGAGALNLGKTEDAAHASGDVGVMALAVKNVGASTLAGTEGDYSPIAVNATGDIYTEIRASTLLTNNITQWGGSSVLGGTGISGAGSPRVTLSSDSPPNKAEDAAHTTADVGAFVLGVRNDAGAALTSTDLDYSPIATDSAGRVKVIVDSQAPGTGATNLGKAEDAAHTSADVGVMMLGVRKESSSQTTSADGDYAAPAIDAYSVPFVRMDHPNRLSCSADNIAATLTQMTNCGAPGAGLAIYLTDIFAVSTTATAGTMSLQIGTGSNCGTGTIALYPPAGTTRRVGYPGNTAATGPLQMHFQTPYRASTNNALCVIGVATNTVNILVQGFIAP